MMWLLICLIHNGLIILGKVKLCYTSKVIFKISAAPENNGKLPKSVHSMLL